jgi:hypothetical protein
MYVFMYICMYACMYLFMYACMYVCMHVGRYVCMCVCIYVLMYLKLRAWISIPCATRQQKFNPNPQNSTNIITSVTAHKYLTLSLPNNLKLQMLTLSFRQWLFSIENNKIFKVAFIYIISIVETAYLGNLNNFHSNTIWTDVLIYETGGAHVASYRRCKRREKVKFSLCLTN